MIAILIGAVISISNSPVGVQSFAALRAPEQASTPEEKKDTTRVRIGGQQMAKQLVHKVQPEYPEKARKERVQGVVRLHIIVGTTGKVQELEFVSGPDLLKDSAMAAVRKWEYRPTLLNGKPVEVDTVVDVVYSMIS